ncbi:MAG: fructosamine kinase family protein, partial [Verrucomicrobiota bacterium]|nr:fructosamine kinase family protein [Verrucomicrobiota bacterium]
MWDEIVEQISAATGVAFRLTDSRPVGGGYINETYRLDGNGGPFFAKLNRADELEMFEAEADGLRDIAATETIRVPRPVCLGISGGQAYLILEHIELGGGGSQSELGRCLAKLHAVLQPNFGWRRDNTIGSTPQPNPSGDDWVAFLREHRLGFQCRLAKRNALRLDGADDLLSQLNGFFAAYEPRPSLLHGDLWNG